MSRFADVVLLRTNRFVMGVIVELDFAQLNGPHYPPNKFKYELYYCYRGGGALCNDLVGRVHGFGVDPPCYTTVSVYAPTCDFLSLCCR